MPRLLLILGAAALVAVLVWRPPAIAPPTAVATASASFAPRHRRNTDRPHTADVVVYVAGAVRQPGLYHLNSGARADDAVRSAGGFRSDADSGAVNLAAHVADGDEVYIAVLGEPTAGPSRARRPKSTRKKSVTEIVDVNTASAQQLAMVPGIGSTLAARIVEVRERDGAYASFDELLDVAGMTASRLQRAESYLRI